MSVISLSQRFYMQKTPYLILYLLYNKKSTYLVMTPKGDTTLFMLKSGNVNNLYLQLCEVNKKKN
jgi:hypothetical protein